MCLYKSYVYVCVYLGYHDASVRRSTQDNHLAGLGVK